MVAQRRVARFGALAAVVVIGVLVCGALLWWRPGSTGQAAMPSPSGARSPGGSASPSVATQTPSPASGSPGSLPELAMPRAIRDGVGLSGGWIFISKSDEDTLRHTTLEAVRIADLP